MNDTPKLPSALRAMSADDILKFVGTNPRKWAQAFLEIYENSDDDLMNEDWVTIWFERAMEAAIYERTRE